MKIAVLGIGFMGFPMARCLCEAGHEGAWWNRLRDRSRVRGASAPLRCTDTHLPARRRRRGGGEHTLENGAIESVLFDQMPLRRDEAGTLVIDMASIGRARGARPCGVPADRGVTIDVRWCLRHARCAAGTLVIMAGGRSEVTRAQPVFAVFGRATHGVCTAPGN